MTMKNGTTFQDKDEYEKKSVIPPIIFCVVLLVSYISVIIFLYKKNMHYMKPAHVHQINYFLAFCFPISSILVTYLHRLEPEMWEICSENYFRLFSFMSINLDMMVMQLDRFLAVYWATHYNTYVTVKVSRTICVSNKVLAMIAVCFVNFLADDFSTCYVDYDVLKSKPHIFMDAYPKVVTVGIILSVSAYMGFTMVNFRENSVQPASNNPGNTLGDEVEGQEQSEEIQLQVKRLNCNSDEFFRVPTNRFIVASAEENYSVGCLNFDIDIFHIAKSALKMNCYLMIFSFSVMPYLAVSIYYRNCVEKSECGTFYGLMEHIFPVRVIGLVLPPSIAIYRIRKYQTL